MSFPLKMNNLNKIIALLLLLAVLPLPYFYYQLLRIVVTLAAVANAYIFFEDKQMARVLAFGIIVLIWNPIFPFYMEVVLQTETQLSYQN